MEFYRPFEVICYLQRKIYQFGLVIGVPYLYDPTLLFHNLKFLSSLSFNIQIKIFNWHHETECMTYYCPINFKVKMPPSRSSQNAAHA
ncbi:hypothetical protein EYC84_008962 [Monilinia fructicola]|uniref:Uncharacterized protein n=1 Tax=Monilinia fructicola TaxID=38448 RepID=A0A5M9JAY1_MONFR|nr:hypothetical protein EYC84_008962 [Monilinia fructicola]